MRLNADLGDHTHGPLTQLRRIPPRRTTCHDSNPPKKWSLPTSRGGSPTVRRNRLSDRETMASSATAANQEKLTDFVEKNGIHTFKIGAVDLDGLWRGKRVSAEHFLNSVHSDGTFFCNILFGWDMQDEP